MKKAIALMLALAGAVFNVQAQDAAAGKQKAEMCIGFHGIVGYQASFPEVYKVPMIAGQGAKYIIGALNAYKKGERKHPTMRAIAGSLSDTDMADLSAFYEKRGADAGKPVAEGPSAAPSAEIAALLTKGAGCASCHGTNFSKPIDASYPKLAGQHSDYLFAALRAYGVEGKPQVGRANAIMASQVKNFRRDELQALAKYLSSLPSELHTAPRPEFR